MRKFTIMLCLAAIVAVGILFGAGCGSVDIGDGVCFDTATTKCGDEKKVDGATDGKTDTGTSPCAVKTWYHDVDVDGYGKRDDKVEQCVAPPGFVDKDSDCNDSNSVIHPGATELCDTLDNDCDGTTDEDCGVANGSWEGYVKIVADSKICFASRGFGDAPPYTTEPAFLVGNNLSWVTNADRRSSVSDSYFCHDTTGWASGTYQLTLVSTKRTNGDTLASGTDVGGGPSFVRWYANYEFCRSGTSIARQFCVKTSTSSSGYENFLVQVKREAGKLVSAGSITTQ